MLSFRHLAGTESYLKASFAADQAHPSCVSIVLDWDVDVTWFDSVCRYISPIGGLVIVVK